MIRLIRLLYTTGLVSVQTGPWKMYPRASFGIEVEQERLSRFRFPSGLLQGVEGGLLDL